MADAPKLTPQEIREVSVIACCDPRTVQAFLAGKPQTSTVAARVKQALAEWRAR